MHVYTYVYIYICSIMYGLTLLRWQQIFTPKCGRKLLIVHTHAMRTLSRYFYECILPMWVIITKIQNITILS